MNNDFQFAETAFEEMSDSRDDFSYNRLAAEIHSDNVAKGFWPDKIMDRNVGEALCLIHSEITEAAEAALAPGSMDDKLTDWPAFWIELADATIRVLDLGAAHGVNFDEDYVDELMWTAYDDDPYGSVNDDLLYLHTLTDRVLESHRKLSASAENGELLYKRDLATLLGWLLATMHKYNVPFECVYAKLDYNRSRPYKHGKKY